MKMARFAGWLCHLAGYRQWGEEENSQISGLDKAASPAEAFLIGQKCRGTTEALRRGGEG